MDLFGQAVTRYLRLEESVGLVELIQQVLKFLIA